MPSTPEPTRTTCANRPRGFALLTGLAAMLTALAVPAAAQRTAPEPVGFRVCNRTSSLLEVAKAVNVSQAPNPPVIVSEGWYKLAAGECMTAWPGELKYRYYLLYAQDKPSGREWRGDIAVCVSRDAFTIRTQGQCGGDYYRRFFFEVDTGDSQSWTHNLRP